VRSALLTVKWLLAILAMIVAAACCASVIVSRPLFDERLDASMLDDVEIAPPDVAVTLARTSDTVILVQAYRDGAVSGIDLSDFAVRDALQAYQRLGLAGLQKFAASGGRRIVTTRAEALLVPFEPRERNIGVGLNYAEHARESNLDEAPFFFPKFATPTEWNAPIAKSPSTLLDYEAEIGLVALRDIDGRSQPELGLVLANDATDRWPLVRGLDRGQPMGTTGFADGKSREGFAPVGALLVIPVDLESFCADVQLRLWRNDRLRQRERGAAMIWKPARIVDEILARRALAYRYRAGDVTLLDGRDRIAAGTIIFSGTPAGVIFKPLNLVNPLVYLRPGDAVAIHANRLGVIRNRIDP
jgi:2,4-didehydro-3-deoxy-L-rhamnonate hydrolase